MKSSPASAAPASCSPARRAAACRASSRSRRHRPAGPSRLPPTFATRKVFEAFWSDDPARALMHGPTFMGNALACAAANASLDLFEQEPRLDQVAQISRALRNGLEPCPRLPRVKDVRVLGAIGAVELERIENLNTLRQS